MISSFADATFQHVIVIGCGLAGLTVSIALAKGGHKVTIVESAPSISFVGAGKPLYLNYSPAGKVILH